MQFWKTQSMVFLLLRSHDAHRQTQRTRVPQILKPQHEKKTVQTPGNLWICVSSFESSLLDTHWQDISKRHSFEKLEYDLFGSEIFHVKLTFKTIGSLLTVQKTKPTKRSSNTRSFWFYILSFAYSFLENHLLDNSRMQIF